MEQEEIYKGIKSKISDYILSLTSLEDFSIAKVQSEAYKDIEDHFEYLMKCLQLRKDHLIYSVNELSLELQNQIEGEKKELKEKIELSNKILESGTPLYQLKREIALEVWETARKITHINNEKKELCVELPSMIEIINSHGKVYTTSISKKVFKASSVSTVAGSTQGKVDGKDINAKMNYPRGVIFNPNDECLYVCDGGNNMIRKVTKAGEVSRFVDAYRPLDITLNKKENCYFVSEYTSHSIRRISLTGDIISFAGCGKRGYQDGEGANALFNYPSGITVNEDTGDVYVSDYSNHVIRKITPQGRVSTLAGSPGKSGCSDGTSQSALFFNPQGICFHSPQQALFVCDNNNNRLRKVSLDGHVSTICEIKNPTYVSILADGSLLLSSWTNHQLFKVLLYDNKSEIELFAGTGKEGSKDGTPQESEFNQPYGVTTDNKTNTCFVADLNNHKIRAIKCDYS